MAEKTALQEIIEVAAIPITVFIIVFGLVLGLTFVNPTLVNIVLMDAVFFTALATILYVIVGLVGMTFSAQTGKAGEGEKSKDVDVSSKVLLYKVGRILSFSAFIYVNLWILIVSPFSFFGGSVYGGIMQLIIIVPLIFLLFNFWVNGSTPGLFMIAIACFLMFPLSFTFPTLFTNLYVLTTGSSAAAGGAAMSNYAVIDPMSYYRSSILQAGITEPVIGPSYEEVSDDVIGVEVEVSGRMCDDSDLVATVSLDNEAKYKLSDVFVQLSAVRDVYSSSYGSLFDICSTTFENEDYSGGRARFVTTHIEDIPKGAPATVRETFRTELSPDILSQFCYLRTDVVLSYHSTSVFPLTFVDYNSYILDPVNIGNPTSTSSFGKVRIDMDVGQQPVPIDSEDYQECVEDDECEADDTQCLLDCRDRLLLKVGWTQKGDGIVNNPEVYLFLPGDLGICQDYSLSEYGVGAGISFEGGVHFQYGGVITEAKQDGLSRFEYPDFYCFNYDEYAAGEYDINDFLSTISTGFPIIDDLLENFNLGVVGGSVIGDLLGEKNGLTIDEEDKTIQNFCNRFFTQSLGDPTRLSADPNAATSTFNVSDLLKFEQSMSVPGTTNVCEDLVEKGYNVCKARFNPKQSDVLFCTLKLDPDTVDVTEVDMNTYLIRADAVYEFHDVTTTLYEIENCDAI